MGLNEGGLIWRWGLIRGFMTVIFNLLGDAESQGCIPLA